MACRMLMKADVTSAPTRADTRHTKLIRLARNAASADTNVVLESRGVVLVVGDDATVVPHATRLAASLKVVMCAPGAQDALGLPRSVRSLGGRIVSITGRMGAFTARAATSRDDSADIGAFGPNPDRTFDLVLDLSRTPHLREAVPPLGYFAPGGSAGAIAEALAILPTLVGRFAKPRYFEYAADLCTHGAQGFSGCSRCIDVCSTAAIASARDRVVVDPYLCQGCANCTLACPTGALSFKAVTRGDVLARCAQAINAARDEGVAQPVLVAREARDAREENQPALPNAARTLDLPALASFGEEIWFAALAQGAAAVVLVADESLEPVTRDLVTKRVELAREVLAAVGTRPERIILAAPEELAAVLSVAASAVRSDSRAAVPNPRSTKRTLMLAAIDTVSSGRPLGPRALPIGAPFGEVIVDRARCTLCRACVNLCPTQALTASDDRGPRLSFVEANCVQCGLCEAGCPEQAITLNPRFVADAAQRSSARVLHADSLARCTSCDTPFMPAKLLALNIARMKDFPGLDDRGGVERLKLCPACRQRAVLDA